LALALHPEVADGSPDRETAGMVANGAGSYPEHLLAREPAPPYAGEGKFALWHFSEDAGLRHFVPRLTPTNPDAAELVWAVDTRHAPMFWFPRDCPRGCIWPVSTTTEADRAEFFFSDGATRVHFVEHGWVERIAGCRLFAYRLPTETFAPHEVGGYWVSPEPVKAIERIELTGLVERHAHAGIALRTGDSIWPFWNRVVCSSVEFSGMRLADAAPAKPPPS
jgi:hypothetical protein